MKESLVSKSFVFTVILLFIGIAVARSINQNVVKASNDNDLVEVTAQACGIKGYGNTTVKLTREQYNNLEQYLVEFRARLNQTSTREEAVPIFKEAVVELDKYKLLPKGMSISQAQKLVIGVEPSEKTQECIRKFLDRIPRRNPDNTLCLLAGIVDNAVFYSLMTIISLAAFGFSILLDLLIVRYHFHLELLFGAVFLISMGLFGYSTFLKPCHIFSTIDFSSSSRGLIYSIGVSGPYKITGQFNGIIRGFTGIRIMIFYLNGYESSIGALFLGSALSMTVSTNSYVEI